METLDKFLLFLYGSCQQHVKLNLGTRVVNVFLDLKTWLIPLISMEGNRGHNSYMRCSIFIMLCRFF